ncbi:MAG TPA: alpha-isopropylmalate synthase regulatory domain-containing protein [Candidatus Omnitrophota bacterium]|nr:alpha-isopropylmalate synthase regulatory domain-containing protein [Candidatus Omnitrophota bacterium]
MGQGSEAQAACYVEVASNGGTIHGAARHENVTMAALMAVASALNRG